MKRTMLKLAKRFVGVAIAMSVAGVMYAAPALNNVVDFVQPDGTTIKGRVHGDEFFNYRTTDDGYVMLENSEGYYEYADPNSATLAPSGVRVDAPQLRSTNNFKANLQKGLTASQQQMAQETIQKNRAQQAEIMKNVKPAPHGAAPVATANDGTQLRAANHSGNVKFLVILVEFTDKKFSKSQGEFNNLLNQENFNGTGSTKDFYKASSWNQFQPSFDVWGPVTVNMTSAEAKASTPTMVYYACQIIESWGCDFTQYDTDNDGIVDNVYCFFAGYDQAQGGDANCIWSHASSIYWKHQYAPDGKWINGYGCSSELKGNSGSNRVNIGTFTHEFGHVIGLPDFYVTSGSGHSPGSWDTMAGGCYLNDSQSPILFSAYEREMLGWCNIPTIPSGDITVPNLQNDRNTPAYRINTTKSNEWYILEYRTRTNTQNFAMPNNGLFIWHIDKSLNGWNSNNPNGVSGHPGYDIFECNNGGTYANIGDGDAQFGSAILWPFGGRNGVDLYDWSGAKVATLGGIADHSSYATLNCGGTSGGDGGGGTTSCTQDDTPVAWVYQDSDYKGEGYGLGEGNFTLSDLKARCIGDDWISSVKVLPGYKLIAYADDNFTGSTISWTSDANFVGGDWNDQITSIKVVTNGTTGKSGLWKIKNRNSGLYWDCDGNSTGENTKVVQWSDEGTEAYQQWELQEVSTGVYHIRPASNLNTRVEVYYGKKDNGTGLVMYPQTENFWNAEFILYPKGDGYFQLIARNCGKPVELASSSTEKGTQLTIWENNGTNCQQWQLLRNQPQGCGHATFYRDCGYTGVAVTLSEGYYDAWQLRLYGIGNDELSSIKVKEGYKVTIWDGEGSGTSKTYAGNVSCLVADDMNDKTSSIAIDPIGHSGLAGTYQVKGYNSKLFWGVKDASKDDNAELQQQTLGATGTQSWKFNEFGTSGVYSIQNVNSGKVLEVANASCNSEGNNRAYVKQNNYVENAYHQQFIAIDMKNGCHKFVDRHSGMVIEVPDNNLNSCSLAMWENNNQNCAQWKLVTPEYDTWVLSAEEPSGNFKDVRWNDINAWGGVEGAQSSQPYEGNGAIAWVLNPTEGWWGWGIHNTYQTLDFAEINDWYIYFYVKTNCTDKLVVRLADTTGDYDVALEGSLEFARNDNWQKVCVPFSAFAAKGMKMDSKTGNVMFSLVCPSATSAGSRNKYVEVDNVYYSPEGNTTVGIVEAVDAQEMSMKIWPNPATDQIHVEGVSNSALITINDLAGRLLLMQQAEEGKATIDITSLESGNYIIRADEQALHMIK